MLTKTEVREYIILRYDPDEVLEILDLSTEELLKYILDLCHKNQGLFIDEEIWDEDT